MSEIAKSTDLTQEEGAPGLRGDPTIEVDGSLYVPGIGLRVRLKAAGVPRETLGRPLAFFLIAATSLVLAAAGWGSAEVMKSIGAPGWTQLAGMFIPTVVCFSLIVLLRLRVRRSGTTRTIRGGVFRR